jgi:hypothetical protein
MLNGLVFLRTEQFFGAGRKGSGSNQILFEPENVLKMVPKFRTLKGSV